MKWAILFLLAGCGGECLKLNEDACVEGGYSLQTVEEAIKKVSAFCSLSQGNALTIKLEDDPPDYTKAGKPIPGYFEDDINTLFVWKKAPEGLDVVLRHELIHSGLLYSGKSSEQNHTDPKLWDCLDRTGSCEGKMNGLTE